MKSTDLSGWIQRYFQEYLVRQRNVSPATVAAYRDTFKPLLRYLRQKRPRHPDMLSLEILTPETVLGFLHHLEQTRSNTIGTRNARLAALRSFIRYLVDWLGPELPACATYIGDPFQATNQTPGRFPQRARDRSPAGGD
jgi:site-specific recombinase XerD